MGNLLNNKEYCKTILFLACLIFLQLAACRPLSAAAEESFSKGQVVMVIVDQIT